MLQGSTLEARQFLIRLIQLGAAFGSILAGSLFFGSSLLPTFFTRDATVAELAAGVLPFVAFMLVNPSLPCLPSLSLATKPCQHYIDAASEFAITIQMSRMGTDAWPCLQSRACV